MRKIIVSFIVIGLLLSAAPLSIGGEMSLDDSSTEELTYDPSEYDFDEIYREALIRAMPKLNRYQIKYEKPEFVPGEFIIKLTKYSTISNPFIVRLNEKYQVSFIEEVFKNSENTILDNIYMIRVPENSDILSIVDDYSVCPDIEYAEPNYIVHICVVPNDQNFSQQWALHNTGQTGGTFDADIDAPEAWNIEKGDEDIVIAILDTGVDYTHPDLVDNTWINDDEILDGNDTDGNGFVDDIHGWDFRNDDNDPIDDYGHGTHCSGIVAAETNNGVGIAGVCWNCSIMPVKIGDVTGIPVVAAANGIMYAADNGADVISMSWGADFELPLICDALDYAYSKGVVLVASAGNSDTNSEQYPAAYDNVIAVAATNNTDKKASFSNYGFWVDVAAPGVDIYSTLPTYHVIMNDMGYAQNYDYMSGTSMACPHVAGLAGLLLSKNHSLNLDMVKTIICNAVDEIDSDEYVGSGRINAHKALLADPTIAILDTIPDWKDGVSGTIDITGTAWGENFQYFVVEHGRGGNPDSWTEIAYSTSPIVEDVLASWDTTEVNEGFYTIRLRVICSNGEYIDTIRVIVNNEINTVYVDDDNTEGPWDGTPEHPYKSIQDGIEGAGKLDEVYVYNGIYYDHVVIDKTINLIGEDKTNTIIDGDEVGIVVRIIADEVSIKGFTIQNSGHGCNFCPPWYQHAGINVNSDYNNISENIIMNNYFPIYLWEGSNNDIYKNTVTSSNKYWVSIRDSHSNIFVGNTIEGVSLSGCTNSIISRNTVKAIEDGGILLADSSHSTVCDNDITGVSGIYLTHSSNCNIFGNTIKNCNDYDHGFAGISCDGSENNIFNNIITNDEGVGIWIVPGSGNNIFDNIITNNKYSGIQINMASGNNIFRNNIANNSGFGGIHIWHWYSSDNIIYHNNLINNFKNNGDHERDSGDAINIWYNSSLKQGNYWDDYIGLKIPRLFDPDGNGIGNYRYKIPDDDLNPFNNDKDRFPFMNPYDPNSPPDPPDIDGPTSGEAGTKYNYTFVSIDPDDDDIASYKINWDDGSSFEVIEGPFASGEVITVNHTWSEKRTYAIRARAKDIYGAEGDWGHLEVTMPVNQQSVQQQSQQQQQMVPQQIILLRGLPSNN